MSSRNAHTELCRAVLLRHGANPNWRIWQNNTGAGKVGGRFVRYGLPGSTDIIGFDRLGRFLAVEIKTGAAVLQKNQEAFRKACLLYNVKYALVRSINDADAFFESVTQSF